MKRLSRSIVLYTLFFTLIFVKPLFPEITVGQLAALMFLDVHQFESLRIEVFNVQYIIMFLLLFYLNFYMRIQNVHDNNSYMGLVLYRSGVKTMIVKMIGKEVWYGFICWGCLSICFLMAVVLLKLDIESLKVLLICVYLIRYCFMISSLVIIYQLYSLMRTTGNLHILMVFLFVIGVLSDCVTGTHFVTYANQWHTELIWMMIGVSGGFTIVWLLVYRLGKRREFYYD